jgi:hypothetical protein
MSFWNRRTRARINLIALIVLLGVGSGSANADFNFASDFSVQKNPNGVWTYGQYAATLPADPTTFTKYQSGGNNGGIDFWGAGAGPLAPFVFHNTTNNVISLNGVTYQPGEAGLYSGPNGEYSVVRFTLPTSGVYFFDFSLTDTSGMSGSFYESRNGVLTGVAGLGPIPSGSGGHGSVSLTEGDTLDFAIGLRSGFGPPYVPGKVEFDITFTYQGPAPPVVPEPSGLILFGVGTACLIAFARWKGNKSPRGRLTLGGGESVR